MSNVKYTQDHEWIKIDGNVATIGITEHAQEQMGDVVFIELPEVGTEVTKGGEAAVVESVKAASEVYAPVTGKIVEINGDLEGEPGKVNQEAEGAAWFIKIELSDPSELEGLMDAAGYRGFIEAN